MRVYFGHPISTYGTQLESDLILQIQHFFCGAEVINPASGDYCKGWADHGMAFFDGQMLPLLDCGVFLPFQDGKWGSGVAYEVRKCLAQSKPCWKILPTREISSLSALDDTECLNTEETRARIRSLTGTIVPYTQPEAEPKIVGRWVCMKHGYQEEPKDGLIPLCRSCGAPLYDDSEVHYEPADVAAVRIFKGVKDEHFSQKDVLTQLILLANAIKRSPGLVEALAELRHTFAICEQIAKPDSELLWQVVGDLCRAYTNTGQMAGWLNNANKRLLEYAYKKVSEEARSAGHTVERSLPTKSEMHKLSLLLAINDALSKLGRDKLRTVQGTIPC